MSKPEDGKLQFPDDVSPEEYAKARGGYQNSNVMSPKDVSPEECAKANESYRVGYKQPPKHTQFKKGAPSVRKGKKRKGYYYEEMFWQIARENVGVKIGNKTVKMSRIEACIRKQAQQALSGDQRALVHFLETFASNSAHKQDQGVKEYLRRIDEERDENS